MCSLLFVGLFISSTVPQSLKAPPTRKYFNLKARLCRDVFRTLQTSKMKFFVKMVDGFE